MTAPIESRRHVWTLYWLRMCVGILAPAPLGTILIISLGILQDPSNLRFDLDGPSKTIWVFVVMSLAAYYLVGVQSIAYSILMEHVVNRHITKDAVALASSAVLGALAGAITLLGSSSWDAWSLMISTGATVGLILGYILRRMYNKSASPGIRGHQDN
jgi:hypothetical protein